MQYVKRRQYASLEDRIYTAGLVDGEGCICISKLKKSPRGLSPYHHLQFSLENTDPFITYWLQERFGGSVRLDKTKASQNHKPTYRWALKKVETLQFLRQLLPYLLIKRPQAELALQFYQQCDVRRRGHKRRLEEDEILKREEFYTHMKELNRQGRLSQPL